MKIEKASSNEKIKGIKEYHTQVCSMITDHLYQKIVTWKAEAYILKPDLNAQEKKVFFLF